MLSISWVLTPTKELTEFMMFDESTPADSAVLADRFLSSVRVVEIVEDMPASSVD